jgi:hypothetical protein
MRQSYPRRTNRRRESANKLNLYLATCPKFGTFLPQKKNDHGQRVHEANANDGKGCTFAHGGPVTIT